MANLDEVSLTLGRIEGKLDLLCKTVDGNGQPGLVQRVGAIESRESNRIGRETVIGAISGGAVGIIGSWLRTHLWP